MSLPKINHARLGVSIVYVDDVENGLACNCTCLSCGQLLVAKNKGKVKEHHFAHHNSIECKYAYETMIHEMAKEIILEDINFRKLPQKMIYFTEVYRYIEVSTIFTNFNFGISEINLGNITPDILLRDQNNKELLIEIKVTHKVDDNKRDKIIKKNLSCLEIDLSDLNRYITKEELIKHIKTTPLIEWINFHISDLEKQKILDDFIKDDKFEIISRQAIKLYPTHFCGTKQRNCEKCFYSCNYNMSNKVLCKYKISKISNEHKNLFITRNDDYFITKIKYVQDGKEKEIKYKTFEEIDNEKMILKSRTITLGTKKYFKCDICENIENLWKQKNRSLIVVVNDKNEVFEITKRSYQSRLKNKYIQAFKLKTLGNVLDNIYEYKKKIWHELIRIKD